MLNNKYMIRKMTAADLDKIMVIENESFTLPWSKDSYAGELRNNFANYLVCDDGGEIIAYGGIWIVFEEAHITNVAVAEAYRGQGIGTDLMRELEKIARSKHATRILLEVRPSNKAAIAVYNKLGYMQTGVKAAYYIDNGEDALVMTCYLF